MKILRVAPPPTMVAEDKIFFCTVQISACCTSVSDIGDRIIGFHEGLKVHRGVEIDLFVYSRNL